MIGLGRTRWWGHIGRIALGIGIVAAVLGPAAAPAAAAADPSVTIGAPTVDGAHGWYIAQPSVSLGASASAGVASLTYVWGSEAPVTQSYASPYPTSATVTAVPPTPGTWMLTATVTDSTGATASSSTTVKWDPDAPAVPTGVTWAVVVGAGGSNVMVQPGTVSGSPTTSPTIGGEWNAATDTVSGVQDYRVQLSTDPSFGTVLDDRFVATTSISYTSAQGVAPGHTYYFRVAARDVAGNVSAFSGPSGPEQVTDQQTGPAVVHAPAVSAFVGQPVSIALEATCSQSSACSARVYYRTTIADRAGSLSDGWTVEDLTQGAATLVSGESAYAWTGTIPGTAVTSAGVDYYVEAEDTYARTQLPGGTFVAPPQNPGVAPPAHAWFHVQPVSPPLIVHTPPAFGQAGVALPISLEALCATTCTATLYYTPTTGVLSVPLTTIPAWPRETMTGVPGPSPVGQAATLTAFSASIPASSVTTAGVDYFVSVTDGSTNAWWPGTSYVGYYVPTDGMRTGYQHVHVLEPPHVVTTPPATAAYRADVSVDAQANCNSGTCSATLYYRTTTTTATDPATVFASAPMSVTASPSVGGTPVVAIHGDIPPAVVDTRGVDYFFSVTDGATTTWWPGTSSVDGYEPVGGTRVGWWHVHVLEPPQFAHVPTTTAPALTPLTISTQLTCATEACTVTLHYTTNGAAASTSTPMTLTGTPTSTAAGALGTYVGTIPAAAVTTQGLSYWMDATDGYTTVDAPGTSYQGAYVYAQGQQLTVFPVHVLEAPHVVHTPTLASYSNQPIPLEARSNCTGNCTATVTWDDLAGNTGSQVMTATPGTSTPLGPMWTFDTMLPAGLATTRGLQYQITVSDGYTSDSTPTWHVTVLAPTAVLHNPVLTASLSQPVPIDAVVPCSTTTCAVTLYYRTSGALLADPAWSATPMSLTSAPMAVGQATAVGHYDAEIPGAVVTTAGVDYYIEASDGATTAYSPGTTWAATPVAWSQGQRTEYYHVTVLGPVAVVHTPVTVAYPNQAITITATVQCSTPTCAGTLSYRTSSGLGTATGLAAYLVGGSAFTDEPMAVAAQGSGGTGATVTMTASIPASAVTTDGVDYTIHVTDGSHDAYWPGTSYIAGPGPVDGIRATWQHIEVFIRPQITHAPPAAYTPGQPLALTATVLVSDYCAPQVTLYYKNLNATAYTAVAVPLSAPTAVTGQAVAYQVTGTIPASAAAPGSTLEYYFAVFDGYQTTYAPTGVAGTPPAGYVVTSGPSL